MTPSKKAPETPSQPSTPEPAAVAATQPVLGTVTGAQAPQPLPAQSAAAAAAPSLARVPSLTRAVAPPVLLSAVGSEQVVRAVPIPPLVASLAGAGYTLVVHEYYGQPYVFAVPQLPSHVLYGSAQQQWWPQQPEPPRCLPQQPQAQQEAPQAEPPQPAAADAAAARGGAQEVQPGELEQTDAIKLMLKLALFVYILGQDGGPHRMALLAGVAVLIFLAQTGARRALLC